MQHTIVKTSPFLITITIKESGKEFEKALKQTIAQWKEDAGIKGWRNGSDIPDEILFKHYSIDAIREDAMEQFIDKLYRKVLSKEEFVPVSAAEVKEMKSIAPFEVDLSVEVLPEAVIDEKKMKKIKLKKTPIAVTPEEVDAAIAQIETRFTTYEAATEGAEIELGDRVLLDTQGFEEKGGKEIVETKVDAFPLLIGSKTFIPGFEEKLIGTKVGQVAEFDITFPKDYHAKEFQGRKVFFVTTIFQIEKAKKPEWTEEFIAQIR